MSSLWTPEGEHPVDPPRRPASPAPGPSDDDPTGPQGDDPSGAPGDEADVEALRRQLAQTPVDVVVANHAFGLFELAALHLSLHPPQLEQARLAIDAVAALAEGLAGRLGEAEPTLKEGLAQLRMAFVQIKAASGATAPEKGPTGEPPPTTDDAGA